MSRSPENINSPEREGKKPLEIAPAKESFSSEEDVIYREGAILADAVGNRVRIDGIGFDFNTGEKMVVVSSAEETGKKDKSFQCIKSGELKDYKRILRDSDYAGEYFLHRREPIAVFVTGCLPKKNAVKLHSQEGKNFEVSYESFIKNYTELPEDYHAPFKHTWLMEKGTRKAVFVNDIDIARRSIEIVEATQIIDTKSGKSNTVILPETKKRVSFEDMGKQFISVPVEPEAATLPFDEDSRYEEAIEVEGTSVDERDTMADSDRQEWEDVA